MSGYLTFPYFFYYPQMQGILNHAALYLVGSHCLIYYLLRFKAQKSSSGLLLSVGMKRPYLTNCFLSSNFLLLPHSFLSLFLCTCTPPPYKIHFKIISLMIAKIFARSLMTLKMPFLFII